VAAEPTDAELLEKVRAGERDAFGELVRRHERAILGLAVRYVGDGEDARDVAQRAFVQAYRQLARFRGEASFRTWLYRIAANLALDALRARGREHRAQAALAAEPAPVDADRLGAHEEKARLREAVEGLPPKQRLVVELRVFEDLSFREVAEVVGSSEDAAKVNFHHALKKLRVVLGEKS
jgi:RNA polymerase sigma-70 factor (ECF subfamily)